MRAMQISYGPPGARGVTQLMAVGDDGAFAAAKTWDLAKVAKLGAAVGLIYVLYRVARR